MQTPPLFRRTPCVRARDEVGGSAVEYGVLISVVVLVVVAAIALFGTLVSDLYANVF